VQTPTLALIVQRYKEISNFTPEKYWELKTVYRDVTFSADVERFKTIEEGQALLDKISGKPFRVDDVQSKNGKESAPPLYDLTSLQVECNQKFGLSADDTLRIAQTLYERKFTTYPRVDTRFLTDDIYPQVKKILGGMTPYANLTAPLLGAAKLPKSKKVFNNLKVTDHHAIIPTGVCPTPDLQRNEKLVYDLIARRFIANFYPDSDIKQTTVLGSVEDIKFKVGGKQIVSPGWRVVYGSAQVDENDGKNEEQAVLPSFVVGETGEHAPKLVEKMTQPPKPYTEATLLRAMETAGKQVDDEELRMLMKENGIGRPSTRAAIIETLFRRHFVTKVKKNLVPTTTGISLVDTIQTPILKSVELTGLWEKKLRQIERGETSVQVFVSDMKQMVTDVVNTIRYASDSHRIEVAQERTEAKSTSQTTAKAQSSKTQQSTTQTAALTCPSCGRPILKGKSAWGCSGFKEGCHLVVPFVVMGKKLTQKQVETLLTKGATPQMKGIEVDGQKKDGQLTFDKEYNIVFKPSEAKAASSAPLTCPLCGGNVLTGKSAWGCSNYVSGCRFRVPFVFMGRKLTATHLQVLIKKGKTNVLDGFIDEHGVQHKGGLVLQPEGGVALEEKV
jgi:DNA topoisomerase-3